MEKQVTHHFFYELRSEYFYYSHAHTIDNNQIKWQLTPELSIYQMLSKNHSHTSKGIYKIILFYWFGSLRSGSAHQSTPATPRLNIEEPQAIARDYSKSPTPVPYFQNSKTETELKITKQQDHPKHKTEASSTFRY